jgi:hypothetical protein
MVEPIVPPAGTPPDQPAQGGKTSAVSGKTQAEIDVIVEDRLKRDREAREKELGVSLKDAKALIAAAKKAEDEKKTELEKLTGERDGLKGELEGTKLQLAKMEALLDAGVPSDKVPKLMKRVSGKTPDDIKADIAEMKADGLIPAATPPAAAQGAGNPGVQNPPPASKIWTEKEIKELRLRGGITDAIMEDIRKATTEGRVQ